VRRSFITIFILLGLTGISWAQSRPSIDEFTVDRDDLSPEGVERGFEVANFSWSVSGLRPDDRLQMHALVGEGWALIGENFESVKTDQLVIAHPLDFVKPTYRLSVVNATGERSAVRIIEIEYAPNPFEPPIITRFSVDATALRPSESGEGQAILPVAWSIDRRWTNSNPVFEQILPDGETVNIELPREKSWLRAEGDGVVQPIPVESGQPLRLRLRVIDVDTDMTLTWRDLMIPAAPNSPDAEDFYVDPRDPAPNSAITIVWSVPAATRVWVLGYSRADFAEPNPLPIVTYAQQPSSGVINFVLPSDVTEGMWFDLYADQFAPGMVPAAHEDLLINPDATTPPRVSYFRAFMQQPTQPGDIPRAAPGETIRAEWAALNADSVRIELGYGILPSAPRRDAPPLPVVLEWDGLPIYGSLNITLPDDERIRNEAIVWLGIYPVGLDGTRVDFPFRSATFALDHTR
jgi:hypothetical protein